MIMKMGYKYNGSSKIMSMSMSEANQEDLKVYTISLPELKNSIWEYSNHEVELVVGEGGYGKWEIKTTEKYNDYTINEIIHEFIFEKREDIRIVHFAIDVTTDYVLISYKETPGYCNLQLKKPIEPYIIIYTDNNYESMDVKKCKTERELCEFMMESEDKKNREIDEIIYIDRIKKIDTYLYIRETIKDEIFENMEEAIEYFIINGFFLTDYMITYIAFMLEKGDSKTA